MAAAVSQTCPTKDFWNDFHEHHASGMDMIVLTLYTATRDVINNLDFCNL